MIFSLDSFLKFSFLFHQILKVKRSLKIIKFILFKIKYSFVNPYC